MTAILIDDEIYATEALTNILKSAASIIPTSSIWPTSSAMCALTAATRRCPTALMWRFRGAKRTSFWRSWARSLRVKSGSLTSSETTTTLQILLKKRQRPSPGQFCGGLIVAGRRSVIVKSMVHAFIYILFVTPTIGL